ncbi:response regulator [Candidatus Latescibacterota bacterium]
MSYSGSFDVLYPDVNIPDGNGLDFLPDLRHVKSSPEVIIITGLGDPDGAELSIKCSAWDYIKKNRWYWWNVVVLLRSMNWKAKDFSIFTAPE